MTSIVLMVVIAAAVTGFVIGAVIGYSTGRIDGNREAYQDAMTGEVWCPAVRGWVAVCPKCEIENETEGGDND